MLLIDLMASTTSTILHSIKSNDPLSDEMSGRLDQCQQVGQLLLYSDEDVDPWSSSSCGRAFEDVLALMLKMREEYKCHDVQGKSDVVVVVVVVVR